MDKITQKINKAFDPASGNSNLVHLNTKQADKFIDYVVDESVVLQQARVIRMDKPRQEIGKVGIGEKIFFPAQQGVTLDTSKRVEATTSKITLITKEMIGETIIYDDELEDNIEGAAFANHLMQMIAKNGANQWEFAALYGEQISNYESEAVDINQLFEGWMTRGIENGNVVDASDTSIFADRFIERKKLTVLKKSFATKYRKSLDSIFMHDDLVMDYEDLYNTNTTTAQGAENRNRFAGIAFTEAPILGIEQPVPVAGFSPLALSAAASAGADTVLMTDTTGLSVGDSVEIVNADGGRSAYGTIIALTLNTSIQLDTPLAYDQDDASVVNKVTLDGTDVLMTAKNNLIWGIQRAVTIEPDRQPRLRATVFVITTRVDVQVENTEAIGILKNLKSKNDFVA
jgi:hypothetical protein